MRRSTQFRSSMTGDGSAYPRKRVLILMATRNGAAWISEQVDSISSQRGDLAVDMAVSDDGSEDATIALLTARSSASGLKVIAYSSSLPGGSAAKNFFRLIIEADIAGYDYVALADQDDVWYSDKIQRAIDCLSLSGAAGYSSTVEAFWIDGRTALLRQSPSITSADFLFEGAGQGCSFVLTATLMRRIQENFGKHINLLQDIHYHDWAIYALCRCQHLTWFFDDRPSLRYRQHSSNDTGARSWGPGLKKRFRLIVSGWYRTQVLMIAKLCASLGESEENQAGVYLKLSSADPSLLRRFRLAVFVARHGRRKWVDRTVLISASLAGYL